MNQNQALSENSSASIASASASPPQPPIPKRRPAQRIYLKDRPQSIYQLQLSEIQVLNQQLQNYKRQGPSKYSSQPAPPIPHNRSPVRMRQSQNQVQWQRAHPEGAASVVKAGEQFRDQILAASELRSDEDKQKFSILRHIEALARERESLLSSIANEKAKSSLLEQEVFLAKDSSAQQQLRAEVERNQLLGERQGLQLTCNQLENALREANSQLAVIPLYEQRCLQKEGTVALLSQELNQARTELGYFVEKSKYFENNHTVLNENFNNLYMNNLSLSSELKELQRRLTNSEEQLKETNKQVILLKEEKEKLLKELSLDIKEIIAKKRGQSEVSISSDPAKPEESIAISMEQLRHLIKQSEIRSENLQKQIGNKENIVLLEKSMSERLKIDLKNLEKDWREREEHWREAASKEISIINKDFASKILQLEAKNMRTNEEAIKMEQSLKILGLELVSAQKRQFELSSRLQTSIGQSQAREAVINTLKNELEHSKNADNLNKNSISDYERKLNTSMTVQEQLSLSTRANLQQKHSKIRELQDKLSNSREQLVRFQIRLHSLEQDLAYSSSANEKLKSQLSSQSIAKEQLERAFVSQSSELGRTQQEASLKEQIIDKYSNVTEEMAEKIILSQRQIEELKEKCSKLLEQRVHSTAKMQKLQCAFVQTSAFSQMKQQQNVSLQEKVLSLEHYLKQSTAKNLEMDSLIQTIQQELREKERSAVTAEMAFKQAIKNLAIQRDQQIARILQEKSQKIEALISERAASEQEYKKVLAQNKCSHESMRNTIDELSSQSNTLELKIAQQRKVINHNEISLIQHAQSLAKTHEILMETKQKSKNKAEENSKQRDYLIETIKQLQNECQSHKHEKKTQTLLFADSQSKRAEELKTNKQTLTEIAQLLSNERAKSQTLELEKILLVKSLKQVQQTLISQLQIELAQKSQIYKKETARKEEEITLLTTERNSLKNELDSLRLKSGEKESIISKLQTIIQRNNEVYKSEVEFLKKGNLQLQADCSRLLQSSQSRSQIASTTRLEMKNSFLEQTLARTLNQVESMQPLFGEVKQERDQLIKKYILLSNQISSLKSQKNGLQNELDAFAQYFSRISSLYTQIGRHFYNISHLSQGTSIRVIHSVLPLQEQTQLAK